MITFDKRLVPFEVQDSQNEHDHYGMVKMLVPEPQTKSFELVLEHSAGATTYKLFAEKTDGPYPHLMKMFRRVTKENSKDIEARYVAEGGYLSDQFMFHSKLLEKYIWKITSVPWFVRGYKPENCTVPVAYHVASPRTAVVSSGEIRDMVFDSVKDLGINSDITEEMLGNQKLYTFVPNDVPSLPIHGSMKIAVVAGRNDGTKSVWVSNVVLTPDNHMIAIPTTENIVRRHTQHENKVQTMRQRISSYISRESTTQVLETIRHLNSTLITSDSVKELVDRMLKDGVFLSSTIAGFMAALGSQQWNFTNRPGERVQSVPALHYMTLVPKEFELEFTPTLLAKPEMNCVRAWWNNNYPSIPFDNITKMIVTDVVTGQKPGVHYRVMVEAPEGNRSVQMFPEVANRIFYSSGHTPSLWDVVLTYAASSAHISPRVSTMAYTSGCSRLIQYLMGKGQVMSGLEFVPLEDEYGAVIRRVHFTKD